MLGSEQSNFAHPIPRAEAIGRLNDQLRKHGEGGRLVVTRGVRSLPQYDTAVLLRSLAAYDNFDPENDPHGERDFGDIELSGQTLLWKIDYYDQDLTFGSADPADAAVTIRVLTVMLESEY